MRLKRIPLLLILIALWAPFPATAQTCEPVISIQPESQEVSSGSTVTLSVLSDNPATDRYQWYKGIRGDTSDPVADATTERYTTPQLLAETQYWVRVTNACGFTDSATATITIACEVPRIAVHPQGQQVARGSAVTLSVGLVTPGDETFQWYEGSSGDTGSPLSGASGSTFTSPPLSADTRFWVRVSRTCGSVDSDAAVITVTCDPPVITTQPENSQIQSGQSVTLTVQSTGANAFQWFEGPSGDTASPISGANASTFTTQALTRDSSFWIRATNDCGSVNSTTAIITVTCPLPVILTEPESQQITPGTSATLSVQLQSAGASDTFQWYEGGSGDTSSPIAGATSSTFTTPALVAESRFWVRVGNDCGSVNSVTAVIRVTCTAPVISTQPQGQQIAPGASATLSVELQTVSANDAFQWYEGNSGDTSSPIAGATDAAFTTPAIVAESRFWVRAANACGSVDSATAVVSISCELPVISTHPEGRRITPGESVTLSVQLRDSGTYTFQWYEGVSGDVSLPVAGATSDRYTTPQLFEPNKYWVRVANECGPADSEAAVLTFACDAPVIASEPTSQRIPPGSSVTLFVLVNGGANSFQWYRGESGDVSNPIPGAEGDNVTTEELFAQSSFWVRITNECGSTNSATAVISLCAPPVILTQPQPVQIAVSGSTTLSVGATGDEPLTYQWYVGESGDESSPIDGAIRSELNTGTLTDSITYWVRVSNECGRADSISAQVTVGASCVAPSIVTQPADQAIGYGREAELSVVLDGTDPFDFQWFEGASADTSRPVPGATTNELRTQPLLLSTSFWVRISNGCGSVDSGSAVLTVSCAPLPPTEIELIGEVLTGEEYAVNWNEAEGATHYELQESMSADFANPQTSTTNATTVSFIKNVETATRFYYRVRAFSRCDASAGEFSLPIDIAVVPHPEPTDDEQEASVPVENPTPITFEVFVPAPTANGKLLLDTSFVASAEEPWLSVSPASGSIPPSGITLIVTADPSTLPVGTSTGTVKVQSTSTGSTISAVPLSVSLVPPITPAPAEDPTAQTLIIPVVGHAGGSNNSQFQSDVRLTNLATQSREFELTFTPSGANATLLGDKTKVTVGPGQTVAFDDMVKSLYGLGSTGESVVGALRISPVAGSIAPPAGTISTIASSRTYNTTATGTFGQYIPAIPFASFIGGAGRPKKLSLQQLAQSTTYRTNIGFVEAAGQPVTFIVRVFNSAGVKLGEFPEALGPGEQRQVTEYLKSKGIASLTDGRVEVELTSTTGRLTAYASVVDNRTNDPLLVGPIVAESIDANRFVVPGVADLNTGAASWRSDVRVFNASNVSVTPIATFYPQDSSGPVTRQLTPPMQPGEVRVLDSVLQRVFNLTNQGGALHIFTPLNTALVVTARTYDERPPGGSLPNGGTYGQFIPAMTSADGVGVGDRALEVLQLEQSDGFRTNLGLAEVTGQSVIVELTAIVPQSRIALKLPPIGLEGNQFIQIGQVLKQFNIGSAYNARISVKVIGGTGKVIAYGSVIDNQTQDPTYIPAQ